VSLMGEALRMPAGVAVPDELEIAWQWMEQRGFGLLGADRASYFLTPYADARQLGIIFTPHATLEGWLAPWMSGYDQLIPIAEISSSGSQAALWRTDTGLDKFVALGSEGEAFLLAHSAVDFLRLSAVGYVSLEEIGTQPDEPDAVAAVAEFRDWVAETFGVRVPPRWPPPRQNDEFAEWLGAKLVSARGVS
jgi:hypothetical protein